MSIPAVMVPGYPYEGGLYWLLGETTVRHGNWGGYYGSLYGTEPARMLVMAGALAALFERVELISADHALPDFARCVRDERYTNNDLRISIDLSDDNLRDEVDKLADFMVKQPNICNCFKTYKLFENDQQAQWIFIRRVIRQSRLAIESDALLVAGDLFHEIYSLILPHFSSFISSPAVFMLKGLPLVLEDRTFKVMGLNFAPKSYDDFLAIRSSSEIERYAKSFRGAIGAARKSEDFHTEMLNLMCDAMDHLEVSKHVSGALETTCSIASVAALIPGIGTVAALAGLSSDLANREVEAGASKNEWYLIGSKMSEIAIKAALKNA
jgi:hypothetical protein